MVYGPLANRKEPVQDWSIVEGNLDAYYRAREPHQKWARTATTCTDFVEGRQWSEEDKAQLEAEGRPALTFNKTARLVRWAQGFFRNNRREIRYLPGNDGTGTDEVATSLTAAMKQIAEANQLEWKDGEVFTDGIVGARGFYDVRLDFSRNLLGETAIGVQDPLSTYLDPESDAYDPAEWQEVTVDRWMSFNDIMMLYGDPAAALITSARGAPAVVSDRGFDQDDVGPERFFGQTRSLGNLQNDYALVDFMRGASIEDHLNRHRKLIRVLDRQHRQLKRTREFIDLETGQTKAIPDDWDFEKIKRVMQWAQMRQLPLDVGARLLKTVRWTVTAADRVLWDDWSPYRTFTIVPYFATFRRGIARGMVEDLIDPQREINKRRSSQLYAIMTAVNDGIAYEEDSLTEETQEELENGGARPGLHIVYKAGKQKPERMQPPAPPMTFKMLEEAATSDLPEISGINESATGDLDVVQSGRAVLARQQSAVNGAEIYFSNFGRTRELLGRKCLEIIQDHYTEPRLIRTRGNGAGKPQEIWINRRVAAGEIVNNVGMGNYDLAIDEAPVSASFMQGQFAEAMEMLEAGIPIPPDLLVEMSSLPMKEEIKQRLADQQLLQQYMAHLQAWMATIQAQLPPGTVLPPLPVGPATGKPGAAGAAGPVPGMPPMGPPAAPPMQAGPPAPPPGALPGSMMPQGAMPLQRETLA